MRAGTFLIAGAVLSAATVLGGGIAAAEPADHISHDGVYRVGVDIRPGTWESPGPADPARSCDWRRLRLVEGDNTDMSYIIENNYTKLGPIRVTVKPTDAGFKTENCGPWRMVPPVPAPSGSAGR